MSSENRGFVPPEASGGKQEGPDQLPEKTETERGRPRRLQPRRKLSDSEAYDLTAAFEHKMVQNYEPRYLAKGGEHIVYEIPDSIRDGLKPGVRNVLVKVDARVMRKVHEYDAERGLPLDSVDPTILAAVEESLAEERSRFAAMREHFGREHVPNVKQAFIKVPVTPDFLNRMHDGRPPAGWKDAKESWSIVKIQRIVPEIGREGTSSIAFGYLEKRLKEPEASYERITRAYVDNQPPEGFTANEFAVLHPDLSGVFHFADTNPAAADVLRDFVRKSVSYSRKDGDILDTAGDDNIVFFKNGESWDYKLVDAFYSNNPGIIVTGQEIMLKAVRGEALEPHERGRLMNVVNYARGINALADRLGIGERIDVVPDDLKGKIDFYDVITR